MITLRKHIILVLFSAVSLLASAQPHLRTPEMYLGVHGGALGSMYSFTPRLNGTEHFLDAVFLSGNGGLVFRYSAHKCCGLQVEINYMQKGWRENADRADYSVHYTRKLDYIEVPFLTHIYFGKPSFRGFVNLGPQIGYCFRQTELGTRNTATPDAPQYAPIDNRFDWGIAGGLGFYYRHVKAGLFQLEARFNYSLGDTFSNSKTAFFSQSHAMDVSVNLGYFIPIPSSQPHNKKK